MDDEYSKVYEYLLTGACPIGYTKNEKKILRRKALVYKVIINFLFEVTLKAFIFAGLKGSQNTPKR